MFEKAKNPLDKEKGEKVTVYISPRWTFDRVLAIFVLLVMLCEKWGITLELAAVKNLLAFVRVEYDRAKEERVIAIEANGDVVIGVGPRYYAAAGFKSDSEMMAIRLGLPPDLPLWQLIALVNEDNHDNYLKKNHESPSIIDAIRNCQKRQYEFDRWLVLSETLSVFLAWYQAAIAPQRKIHTVLEETTLERTLNRSLNGRECSKFSQMTVRHYINLMWAAGWAVEEIQARAKFWLDARETIVRAKKGLRTAWRKACAEGHVQHCGPVVVLQSDNEDLAQEVLDLGTLYQVVIVQPLTGKGAGQQTVILGKSIWADFTKLAAYLHEQEGDALDGGLWRFDTRSGGHILANGSQMRPLPPTKLGVAHLVWAIKKFAYNLNMDPGEVELEPISAPMEEEEEDE
ncbi:MAG: hypothetical protein WC508_05905 [Patescibacteria group bacterium]